MTHLKLKAPEQLPPHGLTLQQFRPWKNHLRNYLMQDTDNTPFFPDRIYGTWAAQETGNLRIRQLHAEDPDAVALRERLNQQDERDRPNYTAAQHARDRTALLDRRNAQLAKFISLIAMLCQYTEQDQIDQRATSLTWIFDFLEQKYNLSNKGANFLKIANLAYVAGTPYDVFYKQLRAAINDSLLKTGDRLPYRDNEELTADERFTPTLENVTILWALQLIDQRLPSQVFKIFGHQLKGNIRLVDLQHQIFDQIPELLQDIEVAENNRASACQSAQTSQQDEPALQALNLRRPNTFGRGRGSRPFRARGGPPQRVQNTNRKFCRLCYVSGRPSYNSHDLPDCRQLTPRDLDSIQSRLNVLDLEEDTSEDTEPHLIPGWDYDGTDQQEEQ